MNGAALLLVTAALGVDYGWEPAENGELVYIIQVNDVLLDALQSGVPIESEIHPDVRGVRRFKIVAGNSELPRRGAPDVAEAAADKTVKQPPSNAPPAAETNALAAKPQPAAQPPVEKPAANPAAPDLLNNSGVSGLPRKQPAVRNFGSSFEPPSKPAADAASNAFEPRSERTGDMPAIENNPIGAGRNSGFQLRDEPKVETGALGTTIGAAQDTDDRINVDLSPPNEREFTPKPRWSLGDDTPPPTMPTANDTTPEEENNAPPNSLRTQIGDDAPPTLSPAPAGKPIVHRQADYVEETPPGEGVASTPLGQAKPAPNETGKNEGPAEASGPDRPWMPLLATMLLLVMSAALNGYLAWIARDFYRRYRDLALDSRQAGATA